jgi:hypothetical protein
VQQGGLREKASQNGEEIDNQYIRHEDHQITIEKIGLYTKTTVTSASSKGELRIVTRQ